MTVAIKRITVTSLTFLLAIMIANAQAEDITSQMPSQSVAAGSSTQQQGSGRTEAWSYSPINHHQTMAPQPMGD